ncbi:MAG: SDR family oxidoreductase [Flavobacteriales bacterium]|jgi:UDP-glucose 4-epimerase|nr:SDR family oxidoreductase [Flavobacteriales bacterium]MCB0759507.1 SDR family oxidoreductase [Flavobacteriales bacterium]
MKVVVTGGAGYIGAELCAALAKDERVSELVIYDLLDRGHFGVFMGPKLGKTKVRFVQGDVLDSRRLLQELAGSDMVYHLAAKVTTPFADAGHSQFEQVNHWGTAEVVYAIEEVAPKARVVYLSSASVYGQDTGSAQSNVKPSPRSAYGHSKLRGEAHMERLGDHQQVCILRSANVHGHGRCMRFDAVINRFVFQAHFQGRITVRGSGEQRRPFIHVHAVVHTLASLLGPNELAGTYDLVERDWSVVEIVEALRGPYPETELLFIDQHLDLLSMQVQRDERLASIQPLRAATLEQDLRELGAKFAW